MSYCWIVRAWLGATSKAQVPPVGRRHGGCAKHETKQMHKIKYRKGHGQSRLPGLTQADGGERRSTAASSQGSKAAAGDEHEQKIVQNTQNTGEM